MSRPSGLFSSVRTLLSTLLGVVHTRLELVANELQEQKAHLVKLLIYSLLMLFFFGIGFILLTLWLVVYFWDSHRLLILGAVTLTYLSLAVILGLALMRQVRHGPKLFSTSLSELNKDRAELESVE